MPTKRASSHNNQVKPLRDRIAQHYRALLQSHGDSAEAAQYSSRESQLRRFASLVRIGDVRGKRVLDYGCGTAALAEYLGRSGQRPAHYCGVDIVPEFFDFARAKMPHAIFCLPEQLGDRRFDYAFVSGVFNNRRRGNRLFWQETVRSLFARCDEGVAFNLMSTYVDYRDPTLFYENPCRVFDFLKREVTPFVSIQQDYLAKPGSVPFEFTAFAYRKPVSLLMP